MARRKKKRATEEINSSSMADIAFLLLIFFLVTTTVLNEKGVWFTLPKKAKADVEERDQLIKQRNILTVILNSNNKILIGDQIVETSQVKDKAIAFINNNGADANMSENPDEAMLVYRADRGTDAETYIKVLDGLLASYTDLRAEYLNITPAQYLKLDQNLPEDKVLIDKAEKQYPFKLSEAKPSGVK